MQKLTSVQKKALLKGGMEKVIDEIVLAFATIVDSAEYLGHLVLLGREEWGKTKFDKALKKHGAMGVVIDACVRAAKGEIDPRLVLCAESNDRYRNLSKYDVKVQKRILDKGVKVRVFGDDGKPTHRVMRVDELTKEQAFQCLPVDGPRDLEGQDGYVNSRRKLLEKHPDHCREKQSWETAREFADRACLIAEKDKLREDTKSSLEVTNDKPEETKPAAQEPTEKTASSAPEKATAPEPTEKTASSAPEKATAPEPEEPKPDWEIYEGKLVVNNPGVEFTQVELIGILGQLAQAASEVA